MPAESRLTDVERAIREAHEGCPCGCHDAHRADGSRWPNGCEGCNHHHAAFGRIAPLARLEQADNMYEDLSCSNPPDWVEDILRSWREERDRLRAEAARLAGKERA